MSCDYVWISISFISGVTFAVLSVEFVENVRKLFNFVFDRKKIYSAIWFILIRDRQSVFLITLPGLQWITKSYSSNFNCHHPRPLPGSFIEKNQVKGLPNVRPEILNSPHNSPNFSFDNQIPCFGPTKGSRGIGDGQVFNYLSLR